MIEIILFFYANLIESLKAQDYPKELYDIYLIADNCTDATAETPTVQIIKIVMSANNNFFTVFIKSP